MRHGLELEGPGRPPEPGCSGPVAGIPVLWKWSHSLLFFWSWRTTDLEGESPPLWSFCELRASGGLASSQMNQLLKPFQKLPLENRFPLWELLLQFHPLPVA